MTNIIKSQNDPRWGDKDRHKKAHNIIQTLSHQVCQPLSQMTCLDIGCGSGGIAAGIAPHVKSIIGIDSDSWTRWDTYQKENNNLRFYNESIEAMSRKDNSVDIIICNQVYEHVPDPQFLIREIYRILKPGGYCYFGGPNLFFPIEPHMFWPFVHWLPRRLAVRFLKICGSKAILDAYSVGYFTLKKWLKDFEIWNAVPYIIKNPNEYAKKNIMWKSMAYLPRPILHVFTLLSPTFIFIIRKPFC